jgi:hypothetical protein
MGGMNRVKERAKGVDSYPPNHKPYTPYTYQKSQYALCIFIACTLLCEGRGEVRRERRRFRGLRRRLIEGDTVKGRESQLLKGIMISSSQSFPLKGDNFITFSSLELLLDRIVHFYSIYEYIKGGREGS